ncbi:MAG: hypothetical protein AAFY99_10050 [Pseudomonadota bacterium]
MNGRRACFACITALGCVATSPASATTTMFCDGIGSDVSVQILFGGGPILNALEATIGIGKTDITTRVDLTDQPATIVQFKGTEEEIQLDLVDSQATVVLASLRIVRTDDGENEPVQVGYVAVLGNPPAAIECEGP